jgi:threonine dehydrogenase-like Zn-dependent dehydrogenase
MRALCWHGRHDVRVETTPDPKIVNPKDAILEITATAICGSDLHLYDGVIPTMKHGDILGHEFMGRVVELGKDVDRSKIAVGDRVVTPFTIACGQCHPCRHDLWSACDNTNPPGQADTMERLYGYSGSGLFGYSHMMGGYAGGQAEYVRVPFADVGPIKIPDGLDDEQVLFLSDIFPTGYQAAENCDIQEGDTVAIWGCGPVGQFAIRSAFLLGAERVIAIDHRTERLKLAAEGGADTLDFEEVTVNVALKEMTGGRGPDSCIDAVGLEAHGWAVDNVLDFAKTTAHVSFDRPHVLREAILACKKGGHLSIPGVYGGLLDKVPFGAAFGKGLTMKMGQTNMHKYLKPLLALIQEGKIDPSFVISHRLSLEDAPAGYKMFHDDQDTVTKVILRP